MAPDDGQLKISIVPDRLVPVGDQSVTHLPMTTKQAHREYLKRTRGPRRSKEERRQEERRLQAEIRKDKIQKEQEEKRQESKERSEARVKAKREKQIAEDEAKKLAKKKAGLPLVAPRASQATIASFFRGNGTRKKRGMSEEMLTTRSEVMLRPHPDTDVPELQPHRAISSPSPKQVVTNSLKKSPPLDAVVSNEKASPARNNGQSFDLDILEDLFPTGSQLRLEVEEDHDDSGYSEAGITIPDHDASQHRMVSHVRCSKKPKIAHAELVPPQPDTNVFFPFLSTQDCTLSAADIADIESHEAVDRQGNTSKMDTDLRRRDSNSITRSSGAENRISPPQTTVHTEDTITAQDLEAFCDASWSDDPDAEQHQQQQQQTEVPNQPLSTPQCRQSARAASRSATTPAQNDLDFSISSQDLLALEDADWSDIDD